MEKNQNKGLCKVKKFVDLESNESKAVAAALQKQWEKNYLCMIVTLTMLVIFCSMLIAFIVIIVTNDVHMDRDLSDVHVWLTGMMENRLKLENDKLMTQIGK